MPTNVRLKKIVSKHNNVRTDEIIGVLINPVDIGDRIFILSEPLDKNADVRQILTTPVKKIVGNRYHTENSVYELEFLK